MKRFIVIVSAVFLGVGMAAAQYESGPSDLSAYLSTAIANSTYVKLTNSGTTRVYAGSGATDPYLLLEALSSIGIIASQGSSVSAGFTAQGGSGTMAPGRALIQATNSVSIQMGANATNPVWKMQPSGDINGYGKQWTNFVSTQYWQADTAVVATNDFNYSYIKTKKFARDITVTQVDGQSSCGTGNWMICQGQSPASWITNGTYTSSTTGDVSTVAFTLYSTNRLYFYLLGVTCDGYPTNLVGMGASGTFQQTH